MDLRSIQTPVGLFTIAPFDHRGSLAQMFGLDEKTAEGRKLITQLKIEFMDAFSDMCSAVLVDPQYGFPAIAHKAKNTGLLLTLESSGYTDEKSAIPTLVPNWSVRHVRNNYAVAKLLLYYHPEEEHAIAKKKLVIELNEYCKYEHIPFLVEPVIFNPHSKEELKKEQFQEAQLIAVQELQPYCDVLKIQYPGNPLACATITAELDIPWILLSRGMPYEKFKEALQISMENGAKGFAAGRAIWQEISGIITTNKKPDMPKIREFLQTTGRERMQELIQVVEKYSMKSTTATSEKTN
jgi:tagatose-1,6-bisphosphate aldolase